MSLESLLPWEFPCFADNMRCVFLSAAPREGNCVWWGCGGEWATLEVQVEGRLGEVCGFCWHRPGSSLETSLEASLETSLEHCRGWRGWCSSE